MIIKLKAITTGNSYEMRVFLVIVTQLLLAISHKDPLRGK